MVGVAARSSPVWRPGFCAIAPLLPGLVMPVAAAVVLGPSSLLASFKPWVGCSGGRCPAPLGLLLGAHLATMA
eukprot:5193693-Heterocapsa_arctica.AAC.1